MIINPSTVSGSIALDGVTINQNSNNEIQAIGTINPNSASGATAVLYDWEGTLQQYIDQNIAILHPDWICYVTDDIQGGASVYTKSECNNRFVLKDTHEVIEYQEPTAANNWSWYRLYADNWVEQGGRTSNFTNTTVGSDDKEESLLVEMASTNYPVLVSLSYDLTLGNGSIAGWEYRNIFGELTSTTTIQVKQYLLSNGTTGTSNIAIWEVKGKARVGD